MQQGCHQSPRLHRLNPITLQLMTILTANDTIWFWTAARNCSPKPERLEPAAQSFQYLGDNDDRKQ